MSKAGHNLVSVLNEMIKQNAQDIGSIGEIKSISPLIIYADKLSLDSSDILISNNLYKYEDGAKQLDLKISDQVLILWVGNFRILMCKLE